MSGFLMFLFLTGKDNTVYFWIWDCMDFVSNFQYYNRSTRGS